MEHKTNFWEFLRATHIQNVLSVLILMVCSGIAFYATNHEIPLRSEILVNKFFDICLVGAIGWVFIQSKKTTPNPEPGTTHTQITQVKAESEPENKKDGPST